MTRHLPYVERSNWRARASCLGADIESFFPVGEGPVAAAQADEAKAICHNECPVREDCLRFAVTQKIDHGVFGGLDAAGRRALTRRQTRNAPPADPITVAVNRACGRDVPVSESVVADLIAGEAVTASRAERLTAIAIMRADKIPTAVIATRVGKPRRVVERDLYDLGIPKTVELYDLVAAERHDVAALEAECAPPAEIPDVLRGVAMRRAS